VWREAPSAEDRDRNAADDRPRNPLAAKPTHDGAESIAQGIEVLSDCVRARREPLLILPGTLRLKRSGSDLRKAERPSAPLGFRLCEC